MTKVLIVEDSNLTLPVWKECLKKVLGDLYNSLSIKSIKTDPATARIKWTTKKVEGVSEAWGTPEDIIREIDGVEILLVSFAPVTAKVIEAGKDLKLIAAGRGGAHFNVDVATATKRRIPVIHTQGRNADAVADHTFGLIISEARHIARAYAALKDGGLFRNPSLRMEWRHPLPELKDKILGIVGFGNVGRRVAERAKGFGMKILVYDPYLSADFIERHGGRKVMLERLLRQSDFVTLHVKLTPETTHMIGSEQIALMKPTAYLINTSRGSVIDEKALYAALAAKKIAGAGLDVLAKEPILNYPDNPLLKLDNITVTPHMAGSSDSRMVRSGMQVAEAVRRFITGEKLMTEEVENPEVF